MKIKKVLIPATEQVESHTVYYLEVYTREYSWVVDRRYREFYELHEKLVKNHGVDRSLIPPKKYFGFLQPEYVEKRRQALEAYFEMLLAKFEDKLPQEVLTFLDIHKFDVCGVTHSLAKELFTAGDEILTKEQQFTLTPLQLHCITSRLGMAAPTCDSHIPHGEIGNLYDFLYQLKHLKVCGGKKLVELSDNITLKCNIAIFKSLTTLEIDSCEVEPFEGLSVVQAQISKLTVHQSVHLLKDILVDDEIWEQGVLETVDVDGNTSLSPQSNFRAWTALTEADFSRNDLPYIDESVTLLPEVVSLNVSYNSIECIEHLQALSNLVELDLSHNKIASLGSNLNTKLGNIKKLNLAGNELDSVQGLDKLYSLTVLNLRENDFTDIGSILTLGELPCLEYIDFRDNAVTKEPMYRIRVFTAFDDRAEQVELDGNRPTNREMNRIRELLQEEQNFEIINYPTPPQYSVPKKGHKKGKSVDRVICLNDATDFQSSSSVTDSTNSFVDDTDQEFRSKVEKIRQMGGDSWLKILDEMQGEAEMAQVGGSDQVHSGSEKSPSELVRYPQSSKIDTISGGSASPPSQREEQETSDEPVDDDHPRRLQFGFAPELEKLIHEKVESSADLTSGTYMVEVEGEERNKGGTEERMVGVDLDKGLILEIKISTGETFARHRLEDISSVDILQLHGVFCVDIRDIFSKEWRRHRDSLTSGHNKDYRQVAQYRMRSVDDAAELFALLYKFITERSSKESIPSISVQEPLDDLFSGNVVEWPNPLGVQDKLLHRFFDKFLHKRDSRADVDKQVRQVTKDLILEGRSTKRTQTIYQALHAEFIDVGCLRHDRSGSSPERVRLVLWSGCLPYVCPDRELPICLLMTNVNIYLFHSSHLDCPERVRAVTKASDLRQILQCFYSFPVRELNEVVFGLYDQGFRMEVKLHGPRGTFTVLTRDAEKTDKFLVTLSDVLGEPLDKEQSQIPRIRRQFSSGSLPRLSFPDEEKINKLKSELTKSGTDTPADDQNLLMYSIVREIPECALFNAQENGDLTKMLRSLIVTNSEVFLCDEDHVHWPLPSFVRASPSTPQWVVTKSQRINKIIGLDVFELGSNANEMLGVYGLSLIFEHEEVEATAAGEQNCWHLVFKACDERTQLQRSLSQVWKGDFQADLKITYSKPKSFPDIQGGKDPNGFLSSMSSINGQHTPAGEAKKTHRRVGSDNLPILQANVLNGLESLVTLDRKLLDKFFRRCISQKSESEEETLLHVLWTGCMPFLFPAQEFKVCVLLSNLYVYILAEKKHKDLINKKKEGKLRNCEGLEDVKPTICFNWIPISKLRQVCVGLFDQTLRLETELKEDTFTFITRDFHLTSTFLERLNAILSSKHTNDPSPARAETLTTSIYDSQPTSEADHCSFTKTDYHHVNNGVKFIYPNDDTLEILKDAISDFSRTSVDCSHLKDVVILVYLLVFHETKSNVEEPRTLVIMDKSLCLCIEDHVNYPLPLFATGLPESPQYNVQDLRDVKSLSRVEFSDFNSCDFKMVFLPTQHQDEDAPEGFDSASMGDLCVITHALGFADREICWRIVAQTYEEKEKALSLICKLWADIHGGALPVMKAKG